MTQAQLLALTTEKLAQFWTDMGPVVLAASDGLSVDGIALVTHPDSDKLVSRIRTSVTAINGI